MSTMTCLPPISVLRVFTDADGNHGNPLGVLLHTADLPDSQCQQIAHELGFSETVFVDNPATGSCRIFTPSVPLPFAGHPMVGTAWLLAREGYRPEVLRPPAGAVGYGTDGSDFWIVAKAQWCPPWRLHELPNPEAVEKAVAPSTGAHDMVWAWIDQELGTIRARVFASAVGVNEDEATGSAAIPLAVNLNRRLVITQGKGSRLIAVPAGDGRARVGGTVSQL